MASLPSRAPQKRGPRRWAFLRSGFYLMKQTSGFVQKIGVVPLDYSLSPIQSGNRQALSRTPGESPQC